MRFAPGQCCPRIWRRFSALVCHDFVAVHLVYFRSIRAEQFLRSRPSSGFPFIPVSGENMKRKTLGLLVILALSSLLWPASDAARAGRDHQRDQRRRQRRAGRGYSRCDGQSPCTSPRERPTRPSRRRTAAFRSRACASAGRTRSPRRCPDSAPRSRRDLAHARRRAGLDVHAGVATVAETVTVTGESSPVFSSTRTGAATSVTRDELAVLPTVSGRINDITRLTPQSGGSGSFAGQDNRMNNITVDGSYFNNSFGLGGQPGDRTGVAPISLEAIEQVQVSVAPFDVRQGNFVGAGVNTVTRSGTNRLTRRRSITASATRRSSAPRPRASPFNPGTFNTSNTGVLGAAARSSRTSCSLRQLREAKTTRGRSTTFRANTGGEPVGGNVTRVLASRPRTRSARSCRRSFNYDTGPYRGRRQATPAKPFLRQGRLQPEQQQQDQLPLQPARLEHRHQPVELVVARLRPQRRHEHDVPRTTRTRTTRSSRTSSRASASGTRSSATRMSNSLIVGYTNNDESRGDIGKLFPFVDILDGAAPPTRRSAPSRSRRTTSCATTRSSCRTTSPSSATSTR